MTWLRTHFYAILFGIKAALLTLAYAKGRRDANNKHDRQGLEDYRNERQDIDDEISSVGSTDAERVKRLQSIAHRRGAGKN